MSDTTVSKMFLKSKTIWGGLVLGLPPILQAVGLGGIGDAIVEFNPDIMGAIDKLADLVGLVLVIWGRATAEAPIALKTKGV